MAQVDVTVNNRAYKIACDDGQEEHLTRLAEYVDRRVQELVSAVGQVGDSRLLVMASLLIADELSEKMASVKDNQDPGAVADAEDSVVGTMESLAERIERIAAGLEAA